MQLVIVESPSKAKTIEKYLGSGYKVKASMGHVVDLPNKELGIDVKAGFVPTYAVVKGKSKIINEIKKDLKDADGLILAVDPDREGEAIGWHIAKELKLIDQKGRPLQKSKKVSRITFHEITKEAIQEALKSPGKINIDLVDAQQARRLLDRLVGYKLSPLLWKKIRTGLSAGRVQSVAVRLVVEREREREKFKPDEYWSVHSDLGTSEKGKETEVIFREGEENSEPVQQIDGLINFELIKEKDKKIKLVNKAETEKVINAINGSEWAIVSFESKEVKRYPSPPFTTSTLQQSASNRLGFSARRTMQLAQKLYESGLITYMRTDSTNLAATAVAQARKTISDDFGKEYLPQEPKYYKTKSKVAQEAHEAIRPTDFTMKAAGHSEQEQKLYSLIWKRALASQMTEARLLSSNIDVKVGEYLFRANGQRILFKGYLSVYFEKVSENILPENLQLGQKLYPYRIVSSQHFTKPPARYTEATLIKELEKNGIGRPSTYAPTLSTIQDRGYIEKEGKYLIPTDIAYLVNDLLVDNFPGIVDIKFTAKMEEELDDIANGQEDWKKVLEAFYSPFEKELLEKEKSISREDYTILGESEEKCPLCGSPMVFKMGRFGKFLSCTRFPECKGMKGVEKSNGIDTESEEFRQKYEDAPLASDGKEMVMKTGRFGSFWAHPDYPSVKEVKPLLLKEKCPESGHNLVERKGKWGKPFIACSGYPKCKYIKKS